jgi:hypothetical protein
MIEVDRAVDNLVKSGKMFNIPGRRDSAPLGGPPRDFTQQYGMQHLHHLDNSTHTHRSAYGRRSSPSLSKRVR